MTFIVDVVFTWVESTPEHTRRRLKFRETNNDTSNIRFENHDELKFAIRSIHNFAPWVRKIFVICDDYQQPSWSSSLEIIKHSQLYGDLGEQCLPTFNSQSIECHLHKIQGLAEHFIYFNDDMFLGRKCNLRDFFNHSGQPLYTFNGILPGKSRSCQHEMAWSNNITILKHMKLWKQGLCIPRPSHHAVPMLKSSFSKAWLNPIIKPYLLITSKSRFRRQDNVYLIGLLVLLDMFAHRARVTSRRSQRYINITQNTLHNLQDILKYRPHQFCLNDGTINKKVHAHVRQFLCSFFPTPVKALEDDNHTQISLSDQISHNQDKEVRDNDPVDKLSSNV